MCFNTNSRRTDVLAASPPPARHAATSKASRPTEKEQARRVRTTKKINIACSDDEIISKALALRTFIDQHVVQFYASQDEAMRLKAQRTIAIEVFHWANNQLDEDEHRKRQQQKSFDRVLRLVDPPPEHQLSREQHLDSLFKMSTRLADMFKTQDENWAFDVREMDDGAGHKDHNRILFPALRKNSIEVLDSVRSH